MKDQRTSGRSERRGTRTPGPPAPAPDPDATGHPLTFFVSRAERRAILRALRAIDVDRGRALRRALGVDPA